MELQMKVCTRCKELKALALKDFPPHNRTKDGFDSWCRTCRGSYRSANRRGRFRAVMDDDQLEHLIETTADCVICGYVFQSNSEKTVDHDHQSGKIRGILCNHCNRGLGHFRDDPLLLEFAKVYLLEAEGKSEAATYLERFLAEECE
jgi:hypothetical protein